MLNEFEIDTLIFKTKTKTNIRIHSEVLIVKLGNIPILGFYMAHYVGDIVPSKMGCPKGVLAA